MSRELGGSNRGHEGGKKQRPGIPQEGELIPGYVAKYSPTGSIVEKGQGKLDHGARETESADEKLRRALQKENKKR